MRIIDLVFSALVLFLYGMAVVCLGLVVACGFALYAAWESGWGSDHRGVVECWVVFGLALVGAVGFAAAASRVDRAWDRDRRGMSRGFEVKGVTNPERGEASQEVQVRCEAIGIEDSHRGD